MQTHTLIQSNLTPIQFLITDCPQPTELEDYVNLLINHNVKLVIRISKPTYDTKLLEDHDIPVYESYFEDGSTPPKATMDKFFSLLDSLKSSEDSVCIGIHCVSGIGRAPLLVCCNLIDAGMDPYGNMGFIKMIDAVDFVRQKRRGAINKVQLNWLIDSKHGFKRRKSGGFLKKLFRKK